MSRLALQASYAIAAAGNSGKGRLGVDPSNYSALQLSQGTAALETGSGDDGETKLVSITYNSGVTSFGQLDLTVGSVRTFVAGAINSIGAWVKNPGNTYLHFVMSIYETGGSRLATANGGCPPDGKWHFLSICSTQFTSNTLLVTDLIRYFRFRVQAGAKAWVSGDKLYFGKAYINLKSRAKFAICTDDGVVSNVTNGGGFPTSYPASGGNYKDICDYYGFLASAFIITGLVGDSGYMTWAQIQSLADAGWNICNHATLSYVGGGSDGMCLLSAAEVQLDLEVASKAMRANLSGPNVRPDIFGLPQGSWNSDVIAGARAAGMKVIVGIGSYNGGSRICVAEPSGGNFNNPHDVNQTIGIPGWIDFWGRVQVDGSPTLANIQAYIDNLIKFGASGGCYTHGIDATIATRFDGMLAYLRLKEKQGLIDVVTLGEWYSGLSGARINASTGRIAA